MICNNCLYYIKQYPVLNFGKYEYENIVYFCDKIYNFVFEPNCKRICEHYKDKRIRIDIITGEIKHLPIEFTFEENEINFSRLLNEHFLVIIDEKDLTKKQKRNMKVSLYDNKSKLGKILHKFRAGTIMEGDLR